jgi:hypothetical protein
MTLLIIVNTVLFSLVDSDPGMSLSELQFGNFRPYIENYFFLEISAIILLLNIFLFKKPKIQINILRVIIISLLFGILNFFDERSILFSIKDPGIIYFIFSFILVFLSIGSIKKDLSIIRSSNRLR